MNTPLFILGWNFIPDQIILATFQALPYSCVSDTQQTIVKLHCRMASVPFNSLSNCSSLFFPALLRRTPLSERLEQAFYLIVDLRTLTVFIRLSA